MTWFLSISTLNGRHRLHNRIRSLITVEVIVSWQPIDPIDAFCELVL